MKSILSYIQALMPDVYETYSCINRWFLNKTHTYKIYWNASFFRHYASILEQMICSLQVWNSISDTGLTQTDDHDGTFTVSTFFCLFGPFLTTKLPDIFQISKLFFDNAEEFSESESYTHWRFRFILSKLWTSSFLNRLWKMFLKFGCHN